MVIRPHLVARQKDRDVEDPLKTRMNSRRSGTTRVRPILVTFVESKVTRRRNRGPELNCEE